jgi:PmbA protein
MGRLIWSLLGPAFGSSVQQKRSFWSDRLGKPAVSPRFELTDHPLLPRRMGSRLFDSEGIASKVRPVFAGGALTMFFLDTYHAKKLGAEATTGAPSNIVVKLGTGDLESIVSDVGKGIYVTEWNGGNSDSTTGKFSFGASGHVIENGRIGAPVKEMNVTGDLLELFARVVAVGADPWPYGNTSSPTIAFEGVSFSGA